MKTIESNKLIAEFMGITNIVSEDDFLSGEYDGDDVTVAEVFKYHESWDWLMPVVEKIESLGYWIRMDYGDVFIVNDDSDIIIKNPMHEDGYTKLSLVYQVVVEFITWYNAQ